MSDEAALLAAIIAHPDEDTPRLIYADWLHENGQPERAEFIRLQIEITCASDGKQRKQVRHERLVRFRELLVTQGVEWVRPLGVARTRVVFRRGFVEDVHFTDEEILPVSNSAIYREPLYNVSVGVANRVDPNTYELLDTPPGDAVLQRLAAWLYDGRLRTLRLEHFTLSPHAVRTFVDSPSAKGLRGFDLASCAFPSEVVRIVSEAENLTELSELHLGLCELSADDVLTLARTPRLKKLRTVTFADRTNPRGPLRTAMKELRGRYLTSHV